MCIEYLELIARESSRTEGQWRLHILPPDSGSELPVLVAWMCKGRSVSAVALGPKRGCESYTASDCLLVIDAVTRYSDDRAAAAAVRQRLLPLRVPAVRGLDLYGESTVASGLGGDFFDFAEFERDRVAISVGDVSGHGIASALLVSGLQAYVRRLTAEKKTDMAGYLSELNQIACDISPDNFLTALFCAQVELDRGRLLYANAGHEPALLIRGDLRTIETLESTGAVLGLSRRSLYSIQSVDVEPGDTLIVHTGGICRPIECAGAHFEAEVLDVMRQHLYAPAFEIVHQILALPERFGGTVGDGDRTAVVVRFTADDVGQRRASALQWQDCADEALLHTGLQKVALTCA
jgi:serine phosphatase RsbU (regulator of sigma subunit)